MEQWGSGQLKLFELLANVCGRVSEQDAVDVARSVMDASTNTFAEQLQALRTRSAQVDILQEENERLRKELETCLHELELEKARNVEKQQPRAVEHQPSTAAKAWRGVMQIYSTPPFQASANANLAPKPATLSASTSFSSKDGDAMLQLGPPENMQLDFSEDKELLIVKHKETVEAWKTARAAVEELQSKLRQSRQNEKQWIKYVEHLQKGNDKLASSGVLPVTKSAYAQDGVGACKSSDPDGSTLIGTSDAAPHACPFISILDPVAAHEVATNISPRQKRRRADYEEDLAIDISDSQPPLPRNVLHNHTENISTKQQESAEHYSSSTEGDIEEIIINATQADISDPFIKEEYPQTPIVIFARSVKKRKSPEDYHKSPSNVTLKVEQIDSSPIGLARLEFINPNESMDLDEIGQKINTPKKRRQMLMASKESQGHHSSLSSAIVQANGQHMVEAGSASSTSRLPKTNGGKAQGKGISAALQPRSPNKQMLPRTTTNAGSEKRRRIEDRMQGASLLAEDGETYVESMKKPDSGKIKIAKTLEISERNARIVSLLEGPSTESLVLTPRRPVLKSASSTASKQVNSSTNFRGTPSAYNSVSRLGSVKRADETALLEAIDPVHEPFRARPVNRLGIEHFKVNPDYNQGYDFAFSDVVRGREQRKCLPGCTKPECCGTKFRKMAEYLRPDEVTLSQEQRDEHLLEQHMGNDKAKLKTMSKDEKHELLLQAQTKDLARKHGKHRHAYERRRSPPGFWRTDFPSTQEAEVDRAEAAKFERELIQKRYDEAMRGNGPYIFCDE